MQKPPISRDAETVPDVRGIGPEGREEHRNRIGRYPILGELGSGGMGHVYLALDPRLDRRIAIKVLRPEIVAASPLFHEQFEREAKLLAALSSPHIATIYSLETDGERDFLTMELIEGETLKRRLEGQAAHALPTEEWLSISRQIAVALEAAHSHGTLHLDLKPGNVMIMSGGFVKVLDFGMGMAVGRAVSAAGDGRTQTRQQDRFGGTFGYMSPEQAVKEAVDQRADIWAFACVLYECIAGAPAFPGETNEERMRASLEDSPDWNAIGGHVPDRIRRLLQVCLTRDLAFRLDTITQARREIEEEIALRAHPAPGPRVLEGPNNLPAQLGVFIGREAQKKALKEKILESRLVTMTGVGGGGKTRLAIEVGREIFPHFPDGVWLVELAPLGSPELVPDAVAAALKMKAQSQMTPTELLAQQLRAKTLLLILDNCERLVAATGGLAETLLSACPGLRILATSREGLGIVGEVIHQVPPMSMPEPEMAHDLERLSNVESVRLFTTRAAGGSPGFRLAKTNAAAVVQICRRLDGIPLAIELAAARIKALPAEEIAMRLDDRFRLLGSMKAGLQHHQTLRASIDWSYDQLTNREKLLCRRLSLFAGGWSLEAAEAVCGGNGIDDWEVLELLTRLIDKSLVEVDIEGTGVSGKPRYRMLETIREYARERLIEMKEGSETLVKLRRYFVTFAEECEPYLTGPEQGRLMARLAIEDDNLRLALDLCADPRADPEIAWRLSGALGRYWYLRGKWFEGRKAYAEILSRPEPREGAAAAAALNWAGNLAKEQGDVPQARTYLEEALAIRRRLGDPLGLANALHNLGNVLKDQEAFDAARVLYEESLDIQKRLGNQAGIAISFASLGALAFKLGECANALALCEESLKLYRRLGDRAGIATTLNNLGAFAESCGELKRAMEYLDEGLAICKETGDSRVIAAFLNNLGQLAEDAGDLPRARNYYEEGLATVRKLGNRMGIAIFLNNLGEVLAREGETAGARQALQESLSILRAFNDLRVIPALLRSLAILAEKEGDEARAARILAAADAHQKGGEPTPANGDPEEEAARDRLRGAWSSEWAAGAGLTLDEAVRLALKGFEA